MNSSVYSADRATHLRIVLTALLASLGLTLFALAANVEAATKYTSVTHIHPRANIELSVQAAPASTRS